MTRRKLFQKDLAAALGISAPMVTRYKQRGMPTNSIAAARRWRDSELDMRRVLAATHQAQWENSEIPVSSSPAILKIIHRLGALAEKDFDTWGQDLREALRELNRQVPPAARADWPLVSMVVWDLLTADFLRKLRSDPEYVPEDTSSSPVSDEDADYMGEFWFQVAIGAARFNEQGEDAAQAT